MKKFSYEDQFGNRYYDCFFKVGKYINKNIAIELYGVPAEEPGCAEPIMTISTNLGKLKNNLVAIKSYSENKGAFELLKELEIIERIKDVVHFGLVEIPICDLLICEINLTKLKEYSL